MPVNSLARIVRAAVDSATGRIRTTNKAASYPLVEGIANTVNATVVCDVRDVSNVVFHVRNSGTVSLAAGTFAFEASLNSTNGTDGVWFPIQAVRSNANTIETTPAIQTIAAGAGAAQAWEASVNAYAYVRVRCTVAVTASANALWMIQRGAYATEPIPAAQATTITANEGTPFTPSTTITNSAASTNATVVKSSAGTLFNVNVSNINAAARYLKLYNKATAPTVGTDVPVITIPIPAGSCQAIQFGDKGLRFSNGIGFALTTGAADADTGAVAASELKVATSYA